MIRYRTRGVTRPLIPVCSEIVSNSGVMLYLPVSLTKSIAEDDDYDHTYECDRIRTSKAADYAGDHDCYHDKVAATIEGSVSSNYPLTRSAGFAEYAGYYSGGCQYSWISSSGSGLQVYTDWSNDRYMSVLGPGLLSEASVLEQLTDTDYLGVKTYHKRTSYYKVVQVSPWVFAYIICTVNDLANILFYQVMAFYPIQDVGTTWRYQGVFINAKSVYSQEVPNYLYNPEVYWTNEVNAAVNYAAKNIHPVDITTWTYCRLDTKLVFTTSGVSSNLVSRICKDVRKFADAAINNLAPPGTTVWSDLCVASIQGCQQVSINSLAYAKDIISLKSEIESVADLIKGWKNPKTYLKSFLSYKYGVPLTISDTKKLVLAIQNFSSDAAVWNKSYSVVKSQSSDNPSLNYRSSSGFCRTFHYKVYYVPVDNGVLNCIRTLMDWDVWPTLQNDWDLIPLSFVADWFVGVDQLCNRIDASIYSQYLDVKSVVRSTKSVGDISKSMKTYGIDDVKLTMTRYVRTDQRQLDLPSFRLDLGSGFLTHIPEATAIIALSHH